MKYGLGRLWGWWWWGGGGGGGGGGRGLFLCRTLQQPRKLLSAWTFMFHQLHRFTSGKKKKSHLDSYSKPGWNAKHQNTNEKLTASTTHLTNPKGNQPCSASVMQRTSSPSFQPLWLEVAGLSVYFTIIRSAPPSPVSVKTLNVQASVLFNAMVNTIIHVSLVFTVERERERERENEWMNE